MKINSPSSFNGVPPGGLRITLKYRLPSLNRLFGMNHWQRTPRKEGGKTRLRVVVTSRRCRLLDPDNVCPKYVIDLLRYGGVLRDDSPDLIDLEIRQERVSKKEHGRNDNRNHMSMREELAVALSAYQE